MMEHPPITEPIIAPQKLFDFDLLEREVPETNFSYDFMGGMMECPELVLLALAFFF